MTQFRKCHSTIDIMNKFQLDHHLNCSLHCKTGQPAINSCPPRGSVAACTAKSQDWSSLTRIRNTNSHRKHLYKHYLTVKIPFVQLVRESHLFTSYFQFSSKQLTFLSLPVEQLPCVCELWQFSLSAMWSYGFKQICAVNLTEWYQIETPQQPLYL